MTSLGDHVWPGEKHWSEVLLVVLWGWLSSWIGLLLLQGTTCSILFTVPYYIITVGLHSTYVGCFCFIYFHFSKVVPLFAIKEWHYGSLSNQIYSEHCSIPMIFYHIFGGGTCHSFVVQNVYFSDWVIGWLWVSCNCLLHWLFPQNSLCSL
jgi:hypothetical protein